MYRQILFRKSLDKRLFFWNRFKINSGTFYNASKTIAPYLQQFSKLEFCIELVQIRSCNDLSVEQNWQQTFFWLASASNLGSGVYFNDMKAKAELYRQMLFQKSLNKGLSAWNRFKINSGTFYSASKTIAPCLQQFSKLRFCIELVQIRFCNHLNAEQNWQQTFIWPSCSGTNRPIEELYTVGRRLRYCCLCGLSRDDRS